MTSRFILRILPIEMACYASEEEISKAIKPLVERYFPVETQIPQKVIMRISISNFCIALSNPHGFGNSTNDNISILSSLVFCFF